MWLINTTNLQLTRFQECPAKIYAILSHTWGADAEELDFDEFRAGRGRDKVGFQKIRLCCDEAKKNGIRYAWVDTCCIDKRSSTELSEAINSMFAWYVKSKVCYVYLVDVSDSGPADLVESRDYAEAFGKSRWFTRGWTLQELIAPEILVFFTKQWSELGGKAQLAAEIHAVTGIDVDVLKLEKSFLDCSIAQRMSWASLRNTTRIEDKAYCLIGLFDVNISLMYGEGSKAFLRLQKRILKHTNDESIFAWNDIPVGGSGLLAPSPKHFADASHFQRSKFEDYSIEGGVFIERPQYFYTNKGLLFPCKLVPYAINVYIVPLHCSGDRGPFAIFLAETLKGGQYRRIPCNGQSGRYLSDNWFWNGRKSRVHKIFVPDDGRDLQLVPHGGPPISLHIRSDFHVWHHHNGNFVDGQNVTRGKSLSVTPAALRVQLSEWNLPNGVILGCERSCHTSSSDVDYYLHFGFDQDFKAVCTLYRKSKFAKYALLGPIGPKFAGPSITDIVARESTYLPRYHASLGVTFTFYLNWCTFIKVSFRPLTSVEYELTISEKSQHKRESPSTDFCFECLSRNFIWLIINDRSKSYLGLILVFILCQLVDLPFRRSSRSSLLKALCLVFTISVFSWRIWLAYNYSPREKKQAYFLISGQRLLVWRVLR